jgi:UDP-N-acetylmuramoyl-tripeptide--D-alanyl-D-alanine ligase
VTWDARPTETIELGQPIVVIVPGGANPVFTLADVLEGTGGRLLAGNPSAEFTSVRIDSRAVTAGALFVAIRGERQDGHDFVGEALQRGAAGALVASQPEGEPWGALGGGGGAIVLVSDTLMALQQLARHWRRRHRATVIGVTGSVGKTTTKEVIAGVLGQDRPALRSHANLNTEFGLPMCLMELDDTHRAVVLEMGMYGPGDIRCLAQIAEPEIGVVTNVQPVHLERLGTIERIAHAKAELVESLPRTGLAALNSDDPRVAAMRDRTAAATVTYGLTSEAELWADDIVHQGLAGIAFTVHRGGASARVSTALLGTHSIYAALAAVAVAMYVGVPFVEAVGRLATVKQHLRQVVVPGIAGSTIMDDSYNASPGSMLAALDLLAQTPGRHVAVLGDMLELGSFESEGHALVGQRAAEVADWLLTVGHRAQGIADSARLHGMRAEALEALDQDVQAIDRLREGLREGDVVLVKASRSMQLDRVVNAIRASA